MKWYCLMVRGKTVKQPLLVDESDLAGFWAWEFWVGKRIRRPTSGISFRSSCLKNDGNPDDWLLNSDALPIWSPRMQELAAELGITEIQYLPVKVSESDGTQVHGFAIANILSVVDAVDHDASIFDRYTSDWPKSHRGKIRSFRKLVLKNEALAGMHMLRLPSPIFPIYVSGQLRLRYLKEQMTGIGFTKAIPTQ